MTIRVLRVGAAATVQDLGRPGYADLAVATSGAADRGALRRANRVVGNPDGAAGVEVLLGGLWFEALTRLRVAVTGAPLRIRVDGVEQTFGAALELAVGSQVRLGTPATGLRSYLAVAGGLLARRQLGSSATDVVRGLGPAPLRPGAELAVGPHTGPAGEPDRTDWNEPVELRIAPGPRSDWFTADALETLGRAEWMVSPESDRVGVRLAGPDLPRRITTELPSEGMVRGSVQVPPGAGPVLFGADHPTTGGYPVIAVVADRDTDLLGQLRPGRVLRLRW